MKAIMIMFDSLNRKMLSSYGCNETITPNFKRLSGSAVTFDNNYACSLPCMPARKELHTGRANFLHRSWGPIESFDDSMPEILKKNGIYTYLVSDHLHYWEDGGATYHTRYSGWEVSRGQQGDFWYPQVKEQDIGDRIPRRTDRIYRQDVINRKHIVEEADFPQAKTFRHGLEFLEENWREDNWFLQIETFDPHEPFYAPEKYRRMYPSDYEGPHFDWPQYRMVDQSPEQVAACRREYMALLTMCDAYLGKVLDFMDEHDLWKDTMLIVNTDHGFLLSEHDMWGKVVMPYYDELVHTPFFVYDPRCGIKGERRNSLTQNIDIAPTLLEFFGVGIPSDMTGKSLAGTIEKDEKIHDAVIFGHHGGQINVTDGRYKYMRGAVRKDNSPLNNYTLITTHMRSMFTPEELKNATLAEPFSFTKGCPVLKIPSFMRPSGGEEVQCNKGNLLFDLENDPGENNPIRDEVVEKRMIENMIELMKREDAPLEQYERVGLTKEAELI